MKRYEVRSIPGQRAVLDILAVTPEGYRVLLTRYYDGYKRTSEEQMTTELLETCLRTGYLTELAIPEAAGYPAACAS